MDLCLISYAKYNWLDMVGWDTNYLKGNSLRLVICKIAWWVAVHHIWQQRNSVIHSSRVRSDKQIV